MKKLLLLLVTLTSVAAHGEPDYYLLRYLPGVNWNHRISYADQPGLKAHHAYLKELHFSDQLILGGPLPDETGSMMLLRTNSLEEANRIVAGDPGVRTRIIQAEVMAWDVTMSSVRFIQRKPSAPLSEDRKWQLKRVDPGSRLNVED